MADDLVERLHTLSRGDHERGCQGREYHCSCGFDEQAWKAADEAAARITELETALAEAEGRVIAEVVSWLRGQADWHDKNDDGWSGFDRIAQGYREAVDALETGEWKK